MTYDEKNIPKIVDQQGKISFTLSKQDIDKFIDNLRDRYRHVNGNFRFFAAAEYGMEENRPHYHVVIFGMGCQFEEMVADTWAKGFVTMSEIIPQRAAYVAQYTLKKNWKWLEGQHHSVIPEFTRQSRMPGIGAVNIAMRYLEDLCTSRAGAEYISKMADVFKNIELDGKNLPLGNYLRGKLRERLGIPAQRAARLAKFGYQASWVPDPELPYGEDDQKWWDKHRFSGDIIHQSTPFSLHAKKKSVKERLPEAKRRRVVLERKKGKARLAYLSGGNPTDKTIKGIGK